MLDNENTNLNLNGTGASHVPDPPYQPVGPYEGGGVPAQRFEPAQAPADQAAGAQAAGAQAAETRAFGADAGRPVASSGEPVQRATYAADTSGIDLHGDVTGTSSFPAVQPGQMTQGFEPARSGNTDTMPRVAVDTYGGAHDAGTPYYSEAAQQRAGYGRQQGYAAQQGQGVYAAQHAPAAAPARAQKSGSSAGKTFLFGFLGALVACALALGGFALFTNSMRGTATQAVVGTTDQSVINAVDEGQTLSEAVAAKALPSVVAIYNYQDASNMYGYGYGYGYGTEGSDSVVATGMGSGVVISDDGYIITNYHVVENAAKLTVSIDGKERDAKYVGGDSSSDIAVIKVDNTEGLVPADIGDSNKLVIGEWVMTVGAPLGLEQSVATGVVSATNRDNVMTASSSDPYSQLFGGGSSTPEYVYYPGMIQTDAVINPGNSGGALVDADGKLIGINSMLSSTSGNYAGVGFAIPVNYAMGLAKDIIAGKEPTHAMMGVSLSKVNSEIAQRYNLSTDKGAYISAITPNTGAADSDLQVGDIITAIDGKSVTSTTDVTLDIRAHKVGDKVKVTVNRDGEEKDIEVTLGSDEGIISTSDGSGEGQGQGQGQGNGGEQGQGNGGYTQEQLEELLRMFGM